MESKGEKQILDIQDKLHAFCNQFDNIYLYGAGKIAESYLKILHSFNKKPKGVIVSNIDVSNFHGLPIYDAEHARRLVDNKCGVIAAFMGASKDMILEHIGREISVFCLPDDESCALINSFDVVPFLEELSTTYVKGEVIKKDNWHRILVIRLDVLGDLIMTTAFIRELHNNCPNAEITLVVHKHNYYLFKECPYVSNLILYDCPIVRGHLDAQFSRLSEIEQRVQSFREQYWHELQDYDIVFLPCILLQGVNSLETFMLALSSPAKSLVGRVNSFRMDERILYPYLNEIFSVISYEEEEKHEVQYMLDMLGKCGGIINDESIELWCDDIAEEFANNIIPRMRNRRIYYIALGLVGSSLNRNWPIENYREFGLKLMENGANDLNVSIVLFGGKEAIESAACFMKDLPTMYKEKVVNMTGKTSLIQALALMKHCDLYVGADTGLMHMAAACGLPVVELSVALPDCTIAEGGSPKRMGPWNVRSIVLQPKVGLDGCRKQCKQNRSHCIKQIGVDEVLHATINLLRH